MRSPNSSQPSLLGDALDLGLIVLAPSSKVIEWNVWMTTASGVARPDALGRTLDVILDQPVAGEKNVFVGRSQADAPDVDGLVFVTGDQHKLRSGDIVPVEIVAAQDYDLVGVAAGKPIARTVPKRTQLVALGSV